jgi:hypothetical protein
LGIQLNLGWLETLELEVGERDWLLERITELRDKMTSDVAKDAR